MIKIELSIRNLLTIVGVLVGLWLLTKVWQVVLLASVGLLIAAALMPYVDWLWRRTHNRALSVVAVVFAVLAALALVVVIVVPPMIRQGQDLWERRTEYQARAADFADERGWYDLRDRIREYEPGTLLGSSRLVNTGRSVIFGLFTLFTVFFLSAYFLLDARRLKQFLYFSTPRQWHPHIKALLPALQRVVGGYIRGQAITSGSIFLFTFIVLAVMDVPNALALSAIAAIADLIPLVGVYILIAPIALAALGKSVTTAVIVVGLMVLYQQFEDRVLIPRVYGATLRLPTIAVVLAILVGAELLGLAGALLGLPVAAGIRVVVEYFAEVRKESDKRAAPDTAATEGATARGAADIAAPPDQPFAPDAVAEAPARPVEEIPQAARFG